MTQEELHQDIKLRIKNMSDGDILKEKQLYDLVNDTLDYASKMVYNPDTKSGRYSNKGRLKFFTISATKRVSNDISKLKITLDKH